MTTHEHIKRIIGSVREIDPQAVAREIAYLTGARIRGFNPDSAGSRSASTPLPMSDRVDREIHRRHRNFKRHVAAAARSLDLAVHEQRRLLARLTLEAAQEIVAEEVSAKATACSNCKRIVERTAADKLLGGRCRRCYDYVKAHGGDERPQSLWSE